MVQANELRIGNLVIDSKNYRITILSISKKGMCSGYFPELNDYGTEEIKLLKPIPLTEEWLVKFGFEKALDHEGFIKNGLSFFEGFLSNEQKHKLQYVHQLQNLYFALTGE